MTGVAWQELANRFDQELCQYVRQQLQSHGHLSLAAEEIGAAVNLPTGEVSRLLERLVELGALERSEARQARCHECDAKIQDADLVVNECPRCEQFLNVAALEWRTRTSYVREAPRGRDVPWVLVIHGMNTRGSWQEKLSWRIATTYGRSVPVYIHKYGRVQIGAMLRFRQRQLVDSLAATVEEISGPADDRHLGRRPDVIAHSFGTWLVGHLLLRHIDMVLGRVILVGGVIAPDFDWQRLIDAGRVDAVLNHYGGRDGWVPLATWAIPDAGPSGRGPLAGGRRVVNREEADFGHSSFFLDHLKEVYDTVWDPFLRQPPGQLPELQAAPLPDPWSPPPRVVTGLARSFLITLIGLLIGAAALSFMVGAIQLGQALA